MPTPPPVHPLGGAVSIKQIEAIENVFDKKFKYVYDEGALTRVLDYLGPRKPGMPKYIGQQNFIAPKGAFFRTAGKGTYIVVDPVHGLIAYTHTGESLENTPEVSRAASLLRLPNRDLSVLRTVHGLRLGSTKREVIAVLGQPKTFHSRDGREAAFVYRYETSREGSQKRDNEYQFCSCLRRGSQRSYLCVKQSISDGAPNGREGSNKNYKHDRKLKI